MRTNSKRQKLIALPIQVIEVPDGLVLKRGSTEFMIKGADAAEAVRMVLDATSGDGASADEIRSLFAQSAGTQVDALIKNLLDRHLLVPADHKTDPVKDQETSLDVFFWHFGEPSERVIERLNRVRLVILGANAISRQLASSLAACGHRNFLVLDHPRHRNQHFFSRTGQLKDQEWPSSLRQPQPCNGGLLTELGDCLIATSDFGGQQAFCEWNKLCIDQKVHFMPVMLKNQIGYVGPLVIPGETACYECLMTRQRSHMTDADAECVVDQGAFEGRAVNAFHPSMATILGDIAAFELTRFYGAVLPERKVNRLFEVNLLAANMTGRTVIKVPRCAACSPLHQSSQTNLNKVLFPERGSVQ